MKLLVLEFISGGGLFSQSLPESLLNEGSRMLQSLLNDLQILDNIELIVLRDSRYKLPKAYYKTMDVIEINDNFQQIWLESVNYADAVWPIAPETDAILEHLCFDVEQASKFLLNADSKTVALTASKIDTLQRLKNHHIDTVPTCRLTEFTYQWPTPWVIKPNEGAGCEECQLITHRNSLDALINQSDAHKFIIQPYIDGEALSLSVLFNNGYSRLLSINRQVIEINQNRFHLSHCEAHTLFDTEGQFQQLSSKIARILPGLWGYAGIDLILTSDQRLLVLEINPRLTTSYCDLHKTLGKNPAEMIIKQLNNPGVKTHDY